MIVRIPMPLPSAANLREFWAVRARRVKVQRTQVAAYLRGLPPPLPVVVTLTRISDRALDSDNLQGAFKAVRDQVAQWLRINDASPLVTWEYAQRRGEPREVGVEIEIVRRTS